MRNADGKLLTELEQKAKELEQRAASFLEAAQKLRDAAAVISGTPIANKTSKGSASRPKKPSMTRVQELQQFVQSRGDVSRQEAIRESGMPRGTVGALLTRKHGFQQNKDNRWYVPEKVE